MDLAIRTKLSDMLSALTKDRLNQIAAACELAGRSKLKKQELADALVQLLTEAEFPQTSLQHPDIPEEIRELLSSTDAHAPEAPAAPEAKPEAPQATAQAQTAAASVTSPIRASYQRTITAPRRPVTSVKIGRNEPCPCGSGKKYKKCCL
ncbi:SEC-C metal-binding domain-containing protein [Paenibacillus sp. OV219]|uniref:SEC-C metal-binding domain-containing protein n=1 Tax=Paenibacillus sp. OV219 TaxID=1884377 RepID=UPI0008CB9FAD|nr:SEC-C metal-binding domain-containing protein [Paenibacillus sp. OV219]SEO30528.1 SEC-C motif-containing protein [Paenibacillus sp. OV219]